METPENKSQLEGEVQSYNRWREQLTRSVNAYHDWLEANGKLDVQQSIRFYDLLENLNKGRLLLAFLAEFSRGKSELINALFFSSFKERLLPSDVGRTTMCPTEIFHDPNEEPYLKLLSVETRYRDESISQLKNMPVEWSKIRLNINSSKDMRDALKALADTKKVYSLEARMLGLSPMMDETGNMPSEEELVEVPAWRYALINYPHPLLSNGLAILDTPGLNALGMEPELTVSTIPSAHAILFLLSIDTGVTKSDMEIWERYVRPGLPRKIAVLNKIDLMWDELKTPVEIEKGMRRMIATTSQALNLPPEQIFALSAQKGLLAKIRGDVGLVKKSGIEALERYLGEQIVPAKRQILASAVQGEIGAMMLTSRASIETKIATNSLSVDELNSMVGKSREVVQKLWAKIASEKNAYNAALAEYKVQFGMFTTKRRALMDMFNQTKMDVLISRSAQAINDSWTTPGLWRGMRELVKLMSEDFDKIFAASEDIKALMQGAYNTFTEKFGFPRMTIPTLDLDANRVKLKLLMHDTEVFCKDPLNVMTEKSFLIRRFYRSLVAQARTLYSDAKAQSERWIQSVTVPIETQIKDHKAQLQQRLDNLAKINDRTSTINEQLDAMKRIQADLEGQFEMIDSLIRQVSQEPKIALTDAVQKKEEPAGPLMSDDMFQTLKWDSKPGPAAPSAPSAAAPAAPAPATISFGIRPHPDAPPAETTQVSPAIAIEQALAGPAVAVPAAEQAQVFLDLPLRDAERTQAMPVVAAPAAEHALAIPALADPATEQTQAFPAAAAPPAEQTQVIPAVPAPDTEAAPAAGGETKPPEEAAAQRTEAFETSIWRLQEARRILQGLPQDP
jgi:hypothetical protein